MLTSPMSRVTMALVGALLVLPAGTTTLAAHDLPTDVVVQAFVKPQGRHLIVLVRVPMTAMGDVDYPTRGPGGLLDLSRANDALRAASALWLEPALHAYESDRLLGTPRLTATRVSLPSDRSFTSYDTALAHLRGEPLPPDAQMEWNQGALDAAFEFDIESDRSAFSIDFTFARLGVRVLTAVRFLPPTGDVRAFQFSGDPGVVRLDPSWHQAAVSFVRLGVGHILSGVDHLLFLVCLVIPLRRFGALVPVVTAFAVAHSITLLASAFGLAPGALWFPPLIETLIAVSIVYMALENMVAKGFGHRWMVAFGFGLVHGFGFSFALRDSLQFAGAHLVASLLAFNVGVEIGQLLVLLLLIPPLTLLFKVTASERVTTVVVSAVVAHQAWHWMIERGTTLARFPVTWPKVDAAFAVSALGWAILAVVVGGALWGMSLLASRFRTIAPRAGAPDPQD